MDGGSGCPDLAAVAERLGLAGALRLVVSGHIHHAHGVARCGPVVHVNAANASGKTALHLAVLGEQLEAAQPKGPRRGGQESRGE